MRQRWKVALGVFVGIGGFALACTGPLNSSVALESGDRILSSKLPNSASSRVVSVYPSAKFSKFFGCIVAIGALTYALVESDYQEEQELLEEALLNQRRDNRVQQEELDGQIQLRQRQLAAEADLEAFGAAHEVAAEQKVVKYYEQATGQVLEPASGQAQLPAKPQDSQKAVEAKKDDTPAASAKDDPLGEAAALLTKKAAELKVRQQSNALPSATNQALSKAENDRVDQLRRETAEQVLKAVQTLGFEAKAAAVHVGSTLVQVDLELDNPKQVKAIKKMGDAMQYCMSLEAPPRIHIENGRVAITLPRPDRQVVLFEEVTRLEDLPTKDSIWMLIGVDIHGQGHWMRINSHNLESAIVGGAPGSGKSSGIKAGTGSIAKHNPASRVQFVIFDGKNGLEFGWMDNSPYLWRNIACDDEDALGLAEDLQNEIDRRFDLFKAAKETYGDKNINGLDQYNAIAEAESLPYLIVFADEFQALFDMSDPEVEKLLGDIASRGRAAGVATFFCTQRPDRNIIRGQVDGKCSTRIAYSLPSAADSELVLRNKAQVGAESLFGNGDLLYKSGNGKEVIRLQSPLAESDHIEQYLFPKVFTSLKLSRSEAGDRISKLKEQGTSHAQIVTQLWGVLQDSEGWAEALREYLSIVESHDAA